MYRGSVLVVDDERPQREILKMILEDEEYEDEQAPLERRGPRVAVPPEEDHPYEEVSDPG